MKNLIVPGKALNYNAHVARCWKIYTSGGGAEKNDGSALKLYSSPDSWPLAYRYFHQDVAEQEIS